MTGDKLLYQSDIYNDILHNLKERILLEVTWQITYA